MYIAQRSMFPYTLRITPRCLYHNEFARKDGHRESASTAVKPAVQLLQIQEVHPVAHSSACNFCRFLSIFLTCSI